MTIFQKLNHFRVCVSIPSPLNNQIPNITTHQIFFICIKPRKLYSSKVRGPNRSYLSWAYWCSYIHYYNTFKARSFPITSLHPTPISYCNFFLPFLNHLIFTSPYFIHFSPPIPSASLALSLYHFSHSPSLCISSFLYYIFIHSFFSSSSLSL